MPVTMPTDSPSARPIAARRSEISRSGPEHALAARGRARSSRSIVGARRVRRRRARRSSARTSQHDQDRHRRRVDAQRPAQPLPPAVLTRTRCRRASSGDERLTGRRGDRLVGAGRRRPTAGACRRRRPRCPSSVGTLDSAGTGGSAHAATCGHGRVVRRVADRSGGCGVPSTPTGTSPATVTRLSRRGQVVVVVDRVVLGDPVVEEHAARSATTTTAARSPAG